MKNSAKLTLQIVLASDFLWKSPVALQYVLVIVSYHVIAGAGVHKQSARINNIVGLIADLKLMRALKVIGNETHDREHGYSLDVP